MKAYFVKIKTDEYQEELCFVNYNKALEFAKNMNEGEVSITDNVYYATEIIKNNR